MVLEKITALDIDEIYKNQTNPILPFLTCIAVCLGHIFSFVIKSSGLKGDGNWLGIIISS